MPACAVVRLSIFPQEIKTLADIRKKTCLFYTNFFKIQHRLYMWQISHPYTFVFRILEKEIFQQVVELLPIHTFFVLVSRLTNSASQDELADGYRTSLVPFVE